MDTGDTLLELHTSYLSRYVEIGQARNPLEHPTSFHEYGATLGSDTPGRTQMQPGSDTPGHLQGFTSHRHRHRHRHRHCHRPTESNAYVAAPGPDTPGHT